ncbi:hypothetical protein ANO14919_057980 [Xylariales sp. No.14919]|nr:hypothetical protein ANO14919_057980 [Xylariales sp. No.14919]
MVAVLEYQRRLCPFKDRVAMAVKKILVGLERMETASVREAKWYVSCEKR